MYNREHKRQVLIKQSQRDSGNYYKYLKALYNLFLQKANDKCRDYVTGTDVSLKDKMTAVSDCYENAFVSPNIVLGYQKDLKKLGYISVKNVEGEWRIYIIRELDF